MNMVHELFSFGFQKEAEVGSDFYETKYGDLTPPGIQITEQMTAQDVEKLREARRSSRVHRLPNAPQTNFTYGTRAPVAPHRPNRGFPPIASAEFPPDYSRNDSQGDTDDLPF